MDFKTVERLGEISKEVKEIYHNSDFTLCSVGEGGVHLRDKEFLKHFPEGYEVVEHDEEFDLLSITYNDVTYYALQDKEAKQ